MRTRDARVSPLVGRVCRPIPALLLAVVLLWATTLLLDTSGYLGTDTGGKVATFAAMSDRPLGLDPDIGYWAAPWDPSGELHGLVYTSEQGGAFVNVTTLPMVELGAPLYRVGGYRLVLLLPILGCVAAAFAAREMARRLGASPDRAWLVYWVVALGSPLTIYALDAWEHTLGVALILWGIVALHQAVEGRRPAVAGLMAGLAFGAAFSMRTEALVYGFVAAVAAGVWILSRRAVVRAVVVGGATLVGLAAVVAANTALERAALGSGFRAGRASSTASRGGAELLDRGREAVVTFVGVESSLSASSIVRGVLTVGLLAALLVLVVRRAPRRHVVVVGAGLAVLTVARLADGPGFVPGLLAASPLAVFGLVVAGSLWSRSSVRYVVCVALGALPLVWLFQFQGGATPQWGARYALTSGALLLVVGVVGLDRVPRRAGVVLVSASVVLSCLGVGWLVLRSHEIGDIGREVADRPEPVVISTEPFWLRELAAHYDGERWLSVRNRTELDRAAEIVEQADLDSFALIEINPPAEPLSVPGFQAGSSEEKIWLDAPFRVTTYERTQ